MNVSIIGSLQILAIIGIIWSISFESSSRANAFVIIVPTIIHHPLFETDAASITSSSLAFSRLLSETTHVSTTSAIRQSSTNDDNDDNNNNNSTTIERQSPSVEITAVLVGLFFVIVVALLGDQLFATPTTSLTTSRPVIDADALLRDEFRQVPSSVEF